MTQKLGQSEILSIRQRHFLPTANHYHKDPIHLVRAQGTHVYDASGKKYLDAIGGIVCIATGHNHPKIKAKLKAMLDQDEIQHTSLLYLSSHVAELAKKTVEHAPKGLDRVAFTNSGSEANELAFMAARNHTGEQSIVHLQHSYHGGTSGTLAQCGHHTWRFKAQPIVASVSAPAPHCYRCPWGKEPKSCALECVKAVDETIKTSTHGKIAAMIVEPVMGVGGFISPPKEYFHELTKVVKNYGGKYISDEVQTGSGRCGGALFLTRDLAIDADVVTTAKSFGNGAPIGAALMTTELSESMRGKFYFNTFGGDPYQTAQAVATIEIIEEEKLIDNARAMGERLLSGLRDLQKRFTIIGDVRGRGLLMGMELVTDLKTKGYATAETARLLDLAMERGLLIGKGGLYGNVVRFAPPLSITALEIDQILSIIADSLSVLEKEKGK